MDELIVRSSREQGIRRTCVGVTVKFRNSELKLYFLHKKKGRNLETEGGSAAFVVKDSVRLKLEELEKARQAVIFVI